MGVICYFEGMYFDWSTVGDQPISDAMPRDIFIGYLANEYGFRSLDENLRRLKRAEDRGTSYMHGESVQDLISHNQCGENGECIPWEEVIQQLRDRMH